VTDPSLAQLEDTYLERVWPIEWRVLASKLLHELKEARERLNPPSGNRSRPSSRQAPWEWGEPEEDPKEEEDGALEPEVNAEQEPPGEEAAKEPTSKPKQGSLAPGKPGKPKGAPGFGHTQPWPVTATVEPRPEPVVSQPMARPR
jgi:transposase